LITAVCCRMKRWPCDGASGNSAARASWSRQTACLPW
jgi:hypothetical protein